MNFSCLLFDLGGVVVDWDGIDPLLELTRHRITPDAARRFWLESESVKKFSAGRCGPDEFARGCIGELGLSLAPKEFIELFKSWDRGSLPGAHDMLRALGSKYRLACLSNTNALHWRMHREHGLVELFRDCFPSFEIGLGKPDPAAFRYVIDHLQLAPETIIYFDDNPECVHAAAGCGMIARQTVGVDAVKNALKEFGVAV
ncbi:MAG: HAD-IA family hydrolase [Candidatus Sumerlaeia bacterium]